MVANQAQTEGQAKDSEKPKPEADETTDPPPDPPNEDTQPPTKDPEPQILRDEGDNSLIINLKDEDIRSVLELLSQYGELNVLASENVTGKVSATLSGVDVRAALTAILKSTGYMSRYEDDFVFVGTPEDFKEMDKQKEVMATRIYRPNYVSAAELQGLITPLLTANLGTSTVSTAADTGVPSDTVTAGGDAFANGDVLLVQDYESVLVQVDEIVEQLDQRPLQVAIEAVILTVKLNDSNNVGVNFEVLRDKENIRIISGSPITGTGGNTLGAISLNDGGLKIGFLDNTLGALIEALESVGDTNVVASPKVLCLNKQRAEIHIGQELGYVTTTVTQTAATQTVEFLEVGTQLRIRPYIGSDGMIRMELHPELSTGSLRPVQDMTVPDKNVTQVTSNIMCRDGHTIVIGGLIREQLDSTRTQLPLLGSIPLLGPAFRQKTEQITRDEIIVLVTPRIVHDPFAYAEGVEEMRHVYDRTEVFADKMNPIGARYYGRRYYRKAHAAWTAGDVHAALRYINLSIQFDRQSSEALRLRHDIVAVLPQADNNINARLRQGLLPWQRPLVDYSRRGYPWRASEGSAAGQPVMGIQEVIVPEPAAENEQSVNEIEEVIVPEPSGSGGDRGNSTETNQAPPRPLVTLAAQPIMAAVPSCEEDD